MTAHILIKLRNTISLLLLLVGTPTCFGSWLSLSLDENNFVIASRTDRSPDGPVDVSAFNFLSESGLLVPFEGRQFHEPSLPFPYLLANNPNQIAYGHLGSTTTIADQFNTGVIYQGDFSSGDFSAQYGMPSQGSSPVQAVLLSAGQPVFPPTNQPPVQPPVVQPPSNPVIPPRDGASLIGTFPTEGGPISVTATGGDIEASGLDFVSASGGLIPALLGDDFRNGFDGFDFFLSNTENQVTFGNLGTSTTFADGTTTELSVGVRAGTNDIQAALDDGAKAVAFPISAVGLDNEDNLLGGNGQNNSGGMGNGDMDPGQEVGQDPAAVPEPTSLLVWMTLGLCVAWRQRRTSFDCELDEAN